MYAVILLCQGRRRSSFLARHVDEGFFQDQGFIRTFEFVFLDVDLSRCSILMSEWRDSALKYEDIISHWVHEIVGRYAISKVPRLLANRGIL